MTATVFPMSASSPGMVHVTDDVVFAVPARRPCTHEVLWPVRGIGKSRLFWELTHSHRVQARAAEGGGSAGCWFGLECGAVSYGKSAPYLPIIELVPRQLDVDGLEVVLLGATDDDAIAGHDHARRQAVLAWGSVSAGKLRGTFS
jgi:hypothetical protein